MELRHLRYFLAVAEEGTFTAAARRLHIAQPPLSQQIRQLESELGVTLFVRSRLGARLTEAGSAFLERAKRALEEVHQAADAAQRAGRGEAGRIVVGFGGASAMDVLSDAVALHRQRFPDVQLAMHEVGSSEQIRGLVDGRLHVGLLWEKTIDDRLQVEVLRSEPLLAALATSHRLASRRTVSIRDLATEPFVLAPRTQSSSFTDVILAACAHEGFAPHVVQEASESVTVLALVAAGIGVSLCPTSMGTVTAKGVVYRPLATRTPTVQLAMAWRREQDHAEALLVGGFLETCRATVVSTQRRKRSKNPVHI